MTVRSEASRLQFKVSAFEKKPSGNQLKGIAEFIDGYAGVRLAPSRIRVLTALIEAARPKNEWRTGPLRQWTLWADEDHLAHMARASRRTVQRALEQLEGIRTASGLPVVGSERNPGREKVYQVCPPGLIELAEEAVTAPRAGVKRIRHHTITPEQRRQLAALKPLPPTLDATPAPTKAGPGPLQTGKAQHDQNPYTTLAFKDLAQQLANRITGRAASGKDEEHIGTVWTSRGRPDVSVMLAELEQIYGGLDSGCQAFGYRWLRGEYARRRTDGTYDEARDKTSEVWAMCQAERWEERLAYQLEHARAQQAGEPCAFCTGRLSDAHRPAGSGTRRRRAERPAARPEKSDAERAASHAAEMRAVALEPRALLVGPAGEVSEGFVEAGARFRWHLQQRIGADDTAMWFRATPIAVEAGRLVWSFELATLRDHVATTYLDALEATAAELGWGVALQTPSAHGPPRMAGSAGTAQPMDPAN